MLKVHCLPSIQIRHVIFQTHNGPKSEFCICQIIMPDMVQLKRATVRVWRPHSKEI